MTKSSEPTRSPAREIENLPSSTVVTCAPARAESPAIAGPTARETVASGRITWRMNAPTPGYGRGSRGAFRARGRSGRLRVIRLRRHEDALAHAVANALVDGLPLGGGGQRRPPDRARTFPGDAQPAAAVT